MEDKRHAHDVVELAAASGRWPAGTVGTVIEMRDDVLLVEIDDERGHALEYFEIPADVARPVSDPYRQAPLEAF